MNYRKANYKIWLVSGIEGDAFIAGPTLVRGDIGQIHYQRKNVLMIFLFGMKVEPFYALFVGINRDNIARILSQ